MKNKFGKAIIFFVLLASAMPVQSEVKDKEVVKINGLLWTAKSLALTYDKADDYCRTLKQDKGSWRLPTLPELQGLYKNKDGLKKLTIEPDDPSVWSSQYEGANMPEQVDLVLMRNGFVHHRHESKDYGEALCVK